MRCSNPFPRTRVFGVRRPHNAWCCDALSSRPHRDGTLSASASAQRDAGALAPDRRPYRDSARRPERDSPRRFERDSPRRPAREDRPPARPPRSQGQFDTRRDKQQFFSRASWKDIGATPAIIEAVQGLGISKPSHIQAEAYAALVSGGNHVVIADHAGSGKTLAYLLPNIQILKEEEARGGNVSATMSKNPRMIVVCPTEELCTQALMTCRALAKVVKFSSGAFTGGHKLTTQRGMLKDGVDVAICTPGRLRQLLDGGHMELGRCKALVLDEVDVLLGDHGAFTEQVAPLMEMADQKTRFVLVTATLPETVFVQLKYAFPGLMTAIGPNLHRTAVGVTEQLVDCSGGADLTLEGAIKRKLDAMWTVMQQQPVPRTIVFCNKIDTCRDVENFIRRQDRAEAKIAVMPYHAAIDPDVRVDNLRTFLRTPVPGDVAQVLVCTDRASRGIDSVHTEHVILFEFPRDPSEYVRRVGRTARGASGRGVVSVLVLGKQVKLAREIIDRNQKGLPIHTVPNPGSAREVAGTSALSMRVDEY